MSAKKLQSMTVAAALAAGVLSAPSATADEVFLKLGKIQGESLDVKHSGWIDVLSWSWGFAVPSGQKTSPCVQELNVLKKVDAASPEIIARATVGENFGATTLTVEATDSDVAYLYVILQDVKIASFQLSSSSERPTEAISLSFSYADWYYRKKDPITGYYGQEITARIYSGTCGR